ncbi:MAG: DMT family transporter [Rhodospirillales bacterium]|nr:DMT family transporter [Rhodospirillales bacterium]
MTSFSQLSAPVRGALWMIFACACFAALSGLVRDLSHEVHPFFIAFVRSAMIVIIMVGWQRRALRTMRVRRFGMHLLRALAGTAGMLTLFTSYALMPIADATALTFTAPLFATIGAALFLGETVRARRWAATAVGFVGAMIIIRPGFGEWDSVTLIPLAFSFFLAVIMLSIRSLAKTEDTNTIVLLGALLMTPLSLIPAIFVWEIPSLENALLLVVAGVIAFGVQQGMTRAYAAAEASAVMPFDFTRLIFTAIIGYLAFGESPDVWTWVGGGVIFVTTIYIAHREAQVSRAEARAARGTLE